MAVLVTRPDERGKALVDQLNQAGVVALHLPLLSIEAGAELAQLPTKLNQAPRASPRWSIWLPFTNCKITSP